MASTSTSKRSFCGKLLYDLEWGELQAPLQKANVQLILNVPRISKQNSINSDNNMTNRVL
jgi:hypothetical protein